MTTEHAAFTFSQSKEKDNSNNIQGVLNGVRVLDLTTFLSGPFAGQVLGDMGAEVIKVENLNGDGTRAIPPYFVGEDSVYYLSTNRNKKSIAVDLKKEEGRKIIYELMESIDVVIENFRPGVANRLGVDYQTLKAHQPSLIYCSITGFGQTGAYSSRPAYDMIVQALAGSMSITGEKGGDPVRLGVPLGDLAAGLYAVIGILGSLQERNRTNEGQYIDISMLDSQISLLSYLGAYYLHSGQIPGPQGREHDSIPTYRALKSKDGEFILITANSQKMFEGVCKAIKHEDLIKDPRFLNGELRLKYKQELINILEEDFLQFDSPTLLNQLERNDVPCAPIRNVKQALEDPNTEHRNMVVNVEHPSGANIKLIGNPIKYDMYSDENHVSPPLLGQHTRDLLCDLGYEESTVDRLFAEGIICDSSNLKEKIDK